MVVIGLTYGQTANAKSVSRIVIPHKHLSDLETIKWQRRIIRHDKWVIRTRKAHKPQQVAWHRAQLRWTSSELQERLSSALYSPRSLSTSICFSCWDRVHDCEAGSWDEVTGNGFYWGLQWVPSTWNNAARPFGFPTWKWYVNHHTAPSRRVQIIAASKLSLSNWPVCGARY